MRHLLPSFMVLVLLAACGDDDATPDAGSPMDQCLNDADVAILSPHLIDSGTGISPELEDVLFTCGQMVCTDAVLGDDQAAAESCMHECYSTTIIADLSPGCEFCWTQSVLCAANNCAIICLGPDQQGCIDCVLENCDPLTNYCAGL